MKYIKAILIVLICLVIVGTIWYSRSGTTKSGVGLNTAVTPDASLVETNLNLVPPIADVNSLAKALEEEQAFENESLKEADAGVEAAETETQLIDDYSKNYNENIF